MTGNNDLIFVVTEDPEASVRACDTILQLSAADARCRLKGRPLTVLPAGMPEMRNLWLHPQSVKLPDIVAKARRRLMVGFDTAGQDFLAECCESLNNSERMARQAQRDKLTILPLAESLAEACKQKQQTKLWLQKPIRSFSCIDQKLAERLPSYELELCQLDPQIERLSDMYAVRAAALLEVGGNSRKEIAKFWKALNPELERVGAQTALINNGMSLLVEGRAENSTTREVIDVNLFYFEKIVAWAGGSD